MINAGVTHKFGGNRDRKDAIPERYKAGEAAHDVTWFVPLKSRYG